MSGLRYILIGSFLFAFAHIIAVHAQVPNAPTVEEFKELKNALWYYGAAASISIQCGFDHTDADRDAKQAFQRWTLSDAESKEAKQVVLFAAGVASDTPKSAQPPNWCEKQHIQIEEYFVPIHKLSVGEVYTGPLQHTFDR